jgi:hypothetical protein
MPALNAPGIQPRTVKRQMLDVLRNLPAWLAHELANFRLRKFLLRGYGNLRRMFRAFAALPPVEGLDALIYFGQTNLPEALQHSLNAMYNAMHAYIPERYEGKVVLLRAKVPTLFRSGSVTRGWETLAAGGVEVHEIPGRHDDCMSPLHGEDLAATLLHCAKAFESDQPGPNEGVRICPYPASASTS